VIAGAATIAIEIFEDWPEVDTIIVPVGGGGLASGIALAAKSISPRVEIIGVEAAASPAFYTSLRANRVVEVEVQPTIADGLAGNMDPDTITFEYVRQYVDRIELVPEAAIEDAVRRFVTEDHVIAEGAGAVGAAALACGIRPRGQHVAVILSGANIDAPRLARLLSQGSSQIEPEPPVPQ